MEMPLCPQCPVCKKQMSLYRRESWFRGKRITSQPEDYYCGKCDKYDYVRMRMDWSLKAFPTPKTFEGYSCQTYERRTR